MSAASERYRYEKHLRSAPADEIARPALWEDIDSARQRTGGSWEGVKTIRVRQADSVLDETDFTVLEVTVKNGEVWGVRILQRGVYASVTNRGPFLFWPFDMFVQWFSEEREEQDVKFFKQLWHKNKWVGHQTALAELIEVFG